MQRKKEHSRTSALGSPLSGPPLYGLSARRVLAVSLVLAALALAARAAVSREETGDDGKAAGSSGTDMTIAQAAFLGVVEGVTEYLPISSTGHLILAQRAMGLESSDAANAFVICIQSGAIAAVFFLYFNRFRQIFRSFAGRDRQGRALAINLAAAFAPAAAAGLLLEETIESNLFGLEPIVAAWFVGGLLILALARWQTRSRRESRELEGLTWRMALVIGIAQCLALWPGTSRSLATIAGGLLAGLSLSAAVEFSFLLGMITLGAATIYKGVEHGSTMVEAYGAASLATGFVVATVSAAVAVKWMVTYLKRRGLNLFGYYRLLLAAAVGALMIGGFL